MAAFAPPRSSWRPITIFDPPQPITVLAAIPEGAPALIRWRRTTRRIVRAAGPERIAPAWWELIDHVPERATGRWRALSASPRDYYAIEDAAGARYWVFRAGLYASGEDSPTGADDDEPRWFIHGLLA